MSGGRRVVIGVGNPFRRDDGVGWAVARTVEREVGAPVAVVLLDGEPARLLDAWTGAELAVVVDAARTGATPGAVRVVDPSAARTGGGDSHGLGIADAVALGGRLDRLPGRLTVVGIEGADYGDGPGLSPAVEAAVAPAAALVTRLLEGPVPCA